MGIDPEILRQTKQCGGTLADFRDAVRLAKYAESLKSRPQPANDNQAASHH